jgi:hypothetical protein
VYCVSPGLSGINKLVKGKIAPAMAVKAMGRLRLRIAAEIADLSILEQNPEVRERLATLRRGLRLAYDEDLEVYTNEAMHADGSGAALASASTDGDIALVLGVLSSARNNQTPAAATAMANWLAVEGRLETRGGVRPSTIRGPLGDKPRSVLAYLKESAIAEAKRLRFGAANGGDSSNGDTAINKKNDNDCSSRDQATMRNLSSLAAVAFDDINTR